MPAAAPRRRPSRRQVLDEATDRLVELDAAFAPVVAAAGPCTLRRSSPRRSHFAELARAICFQQLAGAAASTIHGRFEALFDGPPTAEAVVALSLDDLRGAGLSGAKAASIRDLAERTLSGQVHLGRFGRMDDAAVEAELVTVRGIGPWTAHMFLMFQLGRVDVWPSGDYGVRKGWTVLHGLEEMPPETTFRTMADPLAGVRSVAAWYCWRAVDTRI